LGLFYGREQAIMSHRPGLLTIGGRRLPQPNQICFLREVLWSRTGKLSAGIGGQQFHIRGALHTTASLHMLFHLPGYLALLPMGPTLLSRSN
jgi:hypothetical protein